MVLTRIFIGLMVAALLATAAPADEPQPRSMQQSETGRDPPQSSQAASRPADAPSVSIDDLLEAARTEHGLPAIAAAVTRADGLVAIGAVGVRRAGHDEPVTIDDCFHIGSCTKAMTATLCAVLVDEGKLRWEMTVEEAFPDLKDRIRAEYRPVTLEQLLLHLSGLPEDRAPGEAFMRVVALSGQMQERRRRMVEIALNQAPAAEPGRKMLYSNFGYAIAGAMCEQAAGQTWEDLMRERIFKPLGMATAGFGAPGDRRKVDQPFGHRDGEQGGALTPVPPGPRADNPAVIGPGGTVHCSLGDWARFAALHLRADGRALGLKPETIGTLHARVRDEGYAFGWGHSTETWQGADVYQHAGSNTMWFALIQISPGRDLAVLVATNCATPAGRKACDEVAKKLVERFDGTP
jgi:CubicO group peptidase (beta-lactamase class C family)